MTIKKNNTSITQKMFPLALSQVPLQAQVNTLLVCIHSACFRTSHKWIHMACNPVCLTYSTLACFTGNVFFFFFFTGNGFFHFGMF